MNLRYTNAALSLVLAIAAISCLGDSVEFSIRTDTPDGWTVTTSGISNVAPFVIYTNAEISVPAIGVTSTGVGTGFFLLGENLTNFDGFWTATNQFYLPPAATNVSLTFSNLGFDDAGVLFLNGTPIAATDTHSASNGTTSGRVVFQNGTASTWSFTGPDNGVFGAVTNGFILGGQNALSATINNTGHGANGVLTTGLVGGDTTYFAMAATVSYDVTPASGSLAIGLYPGLQISATVGATYQLQYTTNVSSGAWLTLTNIVLPSSPYLFFDPTSAASQVSRYYRLVTE
jgi:hypothetical protein